VVCISALKQSGIEDLLQAVLKYLPEGEPFFAEDELTDLSERFFVGEMIREKIYDLFRRRDSLPHHRCRLRVQAKIVSAEDRRQYYCAARNAKSDHHRRRRQYDQKDRVGSPEDIEKFVGQKVFLELFVKVRPKWRENDLFLKEYGYG
jgi:GTP-binding protein Era